MMWRLYADHERKHDTGDATLTWGLDARRPITEVLQPGFFLLEWLLSPPCSKDGGHDKRRSGIRLGTGLGRLGGADCAALSQG
jgi:hypothetical protein